MTVADAKATLAALETKLADTRRWQIEIETATKETAIVAVNLKNAVAAKFMGTAFQTDFLPASHHRGMHRRLGDFHPVASYEVAYAFSLRPR
jgi:hypothetical protein